MERKGRDYTLPEASGKPYFFNSIYPGEKARKTPIPLALTDMPYLMPNILLAGFITHFLLH